MAGRGRSPVIACVVHGALHVKQGDYPVFDQMVECDFSAWLISLVGKYRNTPATVLPKPERPQGFKPDPCRDHIVRRLP